MNRFPAAREAKEFLVAQIVEEANRESVPLSESERKMLYFSEGYWTLPDMMDIYDKFDEEYNQADYERTIAGLVKNALKRDKENGAPQFDAWREAIQRLRTEDHYILIPIDRAGVSLRPPGDSLKLFGTALIIVILVGSAGVLSAKYNIDLDKLLPSWDKIRFFFWAGAASVVIAYVLFRLSFGSKQAKALSNFINDRIVDTFFRKGSKKD